MKHLGNIQRAEGSTHKKKRIGRGPGSGYGGTSTKGHKGAQSRTGYKQNPAFEGGQMPINRRLPKFGFNNRFRKEYQVINVGRLQELYDRDLLDGNKVSFDYLVAKKLISKSDLPLKILGDGELKTALEVTAHKFSESAKQKIESVGGKVIVL